MNLDDYLRAGYTVRFWTTNSGCICVCIDERWYGSGVTADEAVASAHVEHEAHAA
jgi:hypothetical protein